MSEATKVPSKPSVNNLTPDAALRALVKLQAEQNQLQTQITKLLVEQSIDICALTELVTELVGDARYLRRDVEKNKDDWRRLRRQVTTICWAVAIPAILGIFIFFLF